MPTWGRSGGACLDRCLEAIGGRSNGAAARALVEMPFAEGQGLAAQSPANVLRLLPFTA